MSRWPDFTEAIAAKLRAAERERTADEALHDLIRQRELPWVRRWQEATGKDESVYPDYGELLTWLAERAETAERHARDHHLELCVTCVATEAERDAATRELDSHKRLLPSLIAEGVRIERERAESAEAERDAATRRADALAGALRAWMQRDARDVYDEFGQNPAPCICEWSTDREAMLAGEHGEVCRVVRAAIASEAVRAGGSASDSDRARLTRVVKAANDWAAMARLRISVLTHLERRLLAALERAAPPQEGDNK